MLDERHRSSPSDDGRDAPGAIMVDPEEQARAATRR
jgi:hypothetical protein